MSRFRVLAFAVSLLLLFAVFWIKWPQFSFFPTPEALSMLSGYVAFLLIGLTLLLGPIKQWLPRLAPQLLLLRRDLGILGGGCALIHVALVLFIFEKGPRLHFLQSDMTAKGWLGLFFLDDGMYGGGLFPNLTFTGLSNYMGLIAFLILFTLWITSSRYAEKLLGGASWKRIHMSNLLVFVLVVFHALIYINSIKGEPHTPGDFLWIAAVVVAIRLIAFVKTVVSRRAK
ncbi:ferric reductase-like transmembrane domain-containing protein [Brevibacillus borstelensis]|uniref:ferric reductase-like transmembrane domain-containing protein n=1 Tax=Brevibacillus borstelensis TaxID=45462 RepID=UPI0030C58B96